MEWEIFRSWILEGQGWQLHYLWTPHFFRDRRGCMEAIAKQAAEFLVNDNGNDELKVSNEQSDNDVR